MIERAACGCTFDADTGLPVEQCRQHQPKDLVLTPPEDEIDRRSGIGGSDVAAVLGLDPRRSPFDVFLEKRGEAPPFQQNNRTRWGTRLQKAIADGYAEETGRQVKWLDVGMRHPDREFHTGHPDAICIPRAENRAVEVKNAGGDQLHRWGTRGTDDVPERAFFQGLWYMPLLQVTRIDYAVLFGGNDLGVYTQERDEELEATVIERVEKFWRDHVLAGVPPPISATETARDYLRSKFPRHVEEIRPATDEEAANALLLRGVRNVVARQSKLEEELENRLKLSIGDAAGIEGEFGRITWKASKNATKTEWELIARGFGNKYPEEFEALVSLHSREVPGSRRFLPKFTEEGKEKGNG